VAKRGGGNDLNAAVRTEEIWTLIHAGQKCRVCDA
jgi:hypothetical protein